MSGVRDGLDRCSWEPWSQGTGKENQVLTKWRQSKPHGGQTKQDLASFSDLYIAQNYIYNYTCRIYS